MDEIVRQAMAKWPNVPHCYGWLALDARGHWRMRDDRAQALGLPGDRIQHPALLGFINRNYLCDDGGRWYFQNGPQRVYVSLEVAPFIARTDPVLGFVLQTGETLGVVDEAWLTDAGTLVLRGEGRVAAVDDRDMAQCLAMLQLEGRAAEDEALEDWLATRGAHGSLVLEQPSRRVPVRFIDHAALPAQFGFVSAPQPA